MKYDTVEIRPIKMSDKWDVVFTTSNVDRVTGKGHLSAMGFFHYPRRIGKKKAFEKLKQHMIDNHKKEIELLTKSLNELIELSIE
jgi:hypothetical protein